MQIRKMNIFRELKGIIYRLSTISANSLLLLEHSSAATENFATSFFQPAASQLDSFIHVRTIIAEIPVPPVACR